MELEEKLIGGSKAVCKEDDVPVFSEVQAVLSSWVVALLPQNFETKLRSEHLNLQCLKNTETSYKFIGSFKSILEVESKIKQIIKNNIAKPATVNETEKIQMVCENLLQNSVSTTASLLNEKNNLNKAEVKVLRKVKSVLLKPVRVSQTINNKKQFCVAKQKVSDIHIVAKRRSKRLNAGSKYKAMKERSILRVQERLKHEKYNGDQSKMPVLKEHSETSVMGTMRSIDNSDEAAQFKHFCELCSFKTKRISHLKKHLIIHSKISSLYRCNHCSFTTVRLGHLRRHKILHSSTVQRCDLCSYQTDELKLLLRHVKLKHSRSGSVSQTSQVLQCDQCSYKSSNQHLMERHIRIHGLGSHQCELCCYRTWRKEHFIRHVNNVHKNKRPYLCHLCGKAFKRGDALRQHQMTHAEESSASEGSPLFHCETCNKSFRSQSHLFEHTAVHSNDRSFLCEICGASFKTRSVQRKHVQTIHKNPRAHSCSFCSKRFNTLYSLKRHLKVHTTQCNLESMIDIAEGIVDAENERSTKTGLTNDIEQVPALSEFEDVELEPRDSLQYNQPVVKDNENAESSGSLLSLPVRPSVEVGQLVNLASSANSPFQDTLIASNEKIVGITSTVFQGTEVTTALVYLTNTLI